MRNFGISKNPPEGDCHGHLRLARREFATTPVLNSRRAFSFPDTIQQWLFDVFAVAAWCSYLTLGLVCLMLPGFIFGWLLFIE